MSFALPFFPFLFLSSKTNTFFPPSPFPTFPPPPLPPLSPSSPSTKPPSPPPSHKTLRTIAVTAPSPYGGNSSPLTADDADDALSDSGGSIGKYLPLPSSGRKAKKANEAPIRALKAEDVKVSTSVSKRFPKGVYRESDTEVSGRATFVLLEL